MTAIAAGDEAEIRALAHSFFDAIEQADVETVAGIYDDDVIIFHAAERALSSKSQNLARLSQSTASWPGRRYLDRDLRVFPGGFVQRHRMVRIQDGEERDALACIVCDVAEGRITRLYEYFDNTQMDIWRSQ